MESTTLIPYSVHLRPDIHAKIKVAAGERKAASLVRDAITSYIEGESLFDSGYKAGLLDAIASIKKSNPANDISVGGVTIAEILVEQLSLKIPTKAKNGNKKTTAR